MLQLVSPGPRGLGETIEEYMHRLQSGAAAIAEAIDKRVYDRPIVDARKALESLDEINELLRRSQAELDWKRRVEIKQEDEQRIRNAVRVQARDCGQQGWVAFAGLTGSLPQAEHALPPVLPSGGAT